MKQRARELTPTLSVPPLDVPRTRALRRHQILAGRKPQQRRIRAWRRRRDGQKPKNIASIFAAPPVPTTLVNPKRDAKSQRAGRARKGRAS